MHSTLSLVLAAALLALPGPALAKGAAKVELKTNHGTIVLELAPDKAPETVKNFLQYVDDKFYDGTVFHRVINGFMIQGGGFTPDFQKKKTRAAIKNEGKNGLKNARGTIAMARTSDPNSATAQFFINVSDNRSLDFPKPDGHGYAVFGKVTKGLDVVDKIKAVKTGRKGPFSRDCPQATVVIETVRRAK